MRSVKLRGPLQPVETLMISKVVQKRCMLFNIPSGRQGALSSRCVSAKREVPGVKSRWCAHVLGCSSVEHSVGERLQNAQIFLNVVLNTQPPRVQLKTRVFHSAVQFAAECTCINSCVAVQPCRRGETFETWLDTVEADRWRGGCGPSPPIPPPPAPTSPLTPPTRSTTTTTMHPPTSSPSSTTTPQQGRPLDQSHRQWKDKYGQCCLHWRGDLMERSGWFTISSRAWLSTLPTS